MRTQADSLGKVFSDSSAVLFDFDGPICHVFLGLPAPQVAAGLKDLLATIAPSLAGALNTNDPMEVHRVSIEGGPAALEAVEAALTEAEVRAVRVAGEPVEGAVRALRAARASGRRVAIVSNNSSECVWEYLALHDLTGVVHEVIGRPELRPDLMKPSPHPLLSAAAALAVDPTRMVLIGDSVTDVEAALATDARSVGYANKPTKQRALAEAGADAVTLSMESVADALTRLG
ncbi:HAD family hydrolase [Streptomyces sp. NPDC057565]|uniref:HAD family hydrolase n=1 Tax=Streptomyces sp. NPDC057565 TaxID=3346169 RepID=UPI0036757BDF